MTALTAVFDWLLAPLAGLDPALALAIIELATGVLMLVAFRFTSNQEGIRRARRPARLALLAPAAAAVMGVEFHDRGGSLPEVALQAPEGIAVETPAVRIPALGEVNWRIRAAREGVHELRFEVGGKSVTKRVVVAADRRLRTVAPVRSGGGILEAVFAPAEPLIERDLGVAAITVDYPPRPFAVLRFRVHWLLAFFVLSILFAFALKRPLGVEGEEPRSRPDRSRRLSGPWL